MDGHYSPKDGRQEAELDEKASERSHQEAIDYGEDIDHRAITRRILFKLDIKYVLRLLVCRNRIPCDADNGRVLPVLALLFLCSFLDRTNVGNAKIIGLEKDINITNKQYTVGLTVYYATYIARSAPLHP